MFSVLSVVKILDSFPFMQARPGTYALVLKSSSDKWIEVGKLGRLRVRPGFYVYIGSAFGPGGLKARIAHHLKISTRPHWHIDYLRPSTDPTEIWFTYDSKHREHQWSSVLASIIGGSIPITAFGASDCRCPSHLFFFNSLPSGAGVRRRLRITLSPHGKIFVKNHLTK